MNKLCAVHGDSSETSLVSAGWWTAVFSQSDGSLCLDQDEGDSRWASSPPCSISELITATWGAVKGRVSTSVGQVVVALGSPG